MNSARKTNTLENSNLKDSAISWPSKYMKKNCSTRSAFFNRRILIGLFLITVSGILALLAFGVRLDSQKLVSLSALKRGGAGAPLFKAPREPFQATAQNQTATTYRGPRNDARPVEPVRTRPL